MGIDRWKRLQRSSYIVFVAVVVHGVLYQVLTDRPLPAVALLWAAIVGVLAIQGLGWAAFRYRAGSNQGQPLERPE
jgi:DMSO/TMAO reductase YedYZ heme-binding membrane subunit